MYSLAQVEKLENQARNNFQAKVRELTKEWPNNMPTLYESNLKATYGTIWSRGYQLDQCFDLALIAEVLPHLRAFCNTVDLRIQEWYNDRAIVARNILKEIDLT